MPPYKPTDFWETSHSNVISAEVDRGLGVRHVGGGQSNSEAAALYRLRRINADRVLRKADLPPRPRIFELGSGGGYWVDYFQQFSPSIFVGSDLSPTAVERLSQLHPDKTFIPMTNSAEAWTRVHDFGPYDITLAIDVLYHITDDVRWREHLEQLCQNTAPSGVVLIVDYFYEQPADQPSRMHVKHRRMQEYLNVIDRHGFKVEAIQPIFYFLNRVVDGPWRDHSRLLSPVLRFLSSNEVGLRLLGTVDATFTEFARPMNPHCKARFLLARKMDV